MPNRNDPAQPLAFRRHARLPRPEATFIPIDSHQKTIRTAVKSFLNQTGLVVIHGPSGSGRSMVARQVARLLPRQALFLEHPPVNRQQGEKSIQRLLADKPRRVPPLLVVDSLTLDHDQWPWLLRSYAGGPNPLLVVASTAWWLHHQATIQDTALGLGLKLLNSQELTHLANAQLRLKQPLAADLGHDFLQACEDYSEGLVRKVADFLRSEQGAV